MIAIFSRCIEYIVDDFSIHITPYLIESTLELLERTGADLCTHVQYLCMNIILCSLANCSNESADDEVLCGVTFPVSCVIVRYCTLLCTTLKISRKKMPNYLHGRRKCCNFASVSEGTEALAKLTDRRECSRDSLFIIH